MDNINHSIILTFGPLSRNRFFYLSFGVIAARVGEIDVRYFLCIILYNQFFEFVLNKPFELLFGVGS